MRADINLFAWIRKENRQDFTLQVCWQSLNITRISQKVSREFKSA